MITPEKITELLGPIHLYSFEIEPRQSKHKG
jgi:hypothetical protein